MTDADDAARLAAMLRGRRTLVVSGAGVSTGIPDYRGSGPVGRPTVEYEDFVVHEVWRRWVWWRNEASWRLLDDVHPTTAHRAIAALEEAGDVVGVATLNVDRLHSLAGSRNVAELHGRYDTVVCLHCGSRVTRAEMSAMIREHNPGLDVPRVTLERIEIVAARDRRAAAHCALRVPTCPACGGMLKPDVTFVGEPLPEAAVRHALAMSNECDVVLAVGTSLAVTTGMWVVLQAVQAGARLAVLNRGPTDADRIADLRLLGDAGEVLGGVAADLLGVEVP